MKKLLVIILSCMLVLQGCQKKEKITGTKEELNTMIIEMIENEDFSELENFNFTDRLKNLGESGRAGSILDPTISMLGDLISYEESYEEQILDNVMICTPCHFENGDINLQVTFDQDNNLDMIDFGEYKTQADNN